MCRTATWCMAVLVGLSTARADRTRGRRSAGARYAIHSCDKLTVSLPLREGEQGGENLVRNGAGKWVPLPSAQVEDGVLTFTLPAEMAGAAPNLLLIGKPLWLDVGDAASPRVTRALIDGKPVPCSGHIDLGWLDVMPETLELSVADERNPINLSSVHAVVAGSAISPHGKTLTAQLDPKDEKRATIRCSISELIGDRPGSQVRVKVTCDDFAVDEQMCTVELTFLVTRPMSVDLGRPNAIAANSIKVFVDSIYAGYDNVECLVDGELQVPNTTSVGSTWASAERPSDHWVCLVLPQARKLSGLHISWGHYKNTFWTSRRFDIMTWDAGQKAWQRALRVQNVAPARTTQHTFAARETDRVLIRVPQGGNHAEYENVMWLTEITFQP